MPVSPANLFRCLILLAMAGHVFTMYCLARAISEGVGWRLGIAMGSGFFALIMLIPLFWAVTLPELPEAITRFRGQRRWSRGQCPACGYSTEGIQGQGCPECGSALREPHRYTLGMATVRRFAVILMGAWILGSVSGEIWVLHDERAFAREVRQRLESGQDGSYGRSRIWPAQTSSLIYVPGRGIGATD